MERLTNKREADAQREEYERHLANGYPRDIHVERLLRLAAYEDTGLTPEVCANYKAFEDEAISKGVTFKRIVALMDADSAGRLVVLPCKVGDTVYRLQYIEPALGRFTVGVEPIKFALFWLEEFGKTVFLAREEAEAALEAQKGAEHD